MAKPEWGWLCAVCSAQALTSCGVMCVCDCGSRKFVSEKGSPREWYAGAPVPRQGCRVVYEAEDRVRVPIFTVLCVGLAALLLGVAVGAVYLGGAPNG